MRQWHVDPKVMCRQHLLGEHVEHHMFVGSINKNIDCTGYIKDGLLSFETLHARHDALVEEMLRREMNHKSPLPAIECAPEKLNTYKSEPDKMFTPEENLAELRRRCSACVELQEQGGWKP